MLWTGNNSASRGITGVGFQPDLVWTKSRNSSSYHTQIHDSVRGASAGALYPSLSNSEDNSYPISSFDSDGFTTSSGSQNGQNTSHTYVGWFWKADGSASSNSNGSITSSVSANTTAGFSIVKYTGTGSAGTIGHGLSSAPNVVIVKNLDDNSKGWPVLHTSLTNEYLELNSTNDAFSGSTYFNNTAPTASVFSVGTVGSTNESGDDLIAYCFHNVEGYSKFGSFAGNSSADGTFVYLGFRPAYIWLKRDSNGVDWSLFDSKRLGYNVDNNNLRAFASSPATEQTDDDVDFLSNGFKCRRNFANNQGTVLYFAWAEAPFKFANAR